jgi:hypothetical protein
VATFESLQGEIGGPTNMPGLDEVSYSETVAVSAISGFYEILTKMYIDKEAVE